jgi:surface protein
MKKFSLILLISLLSAGVFTACKDIESPAAKMGEVKFTLSVPDFQNTGRPNARVEAPPTNSDWKHIYADNAVLNITNKVNGLEYTLQYNPNDFSVPFSITLPFGSYTFESNVSGGVFESFLPYELEGEFRLSSQSMDITLEATTDYGLVTVKNQFVTEASISATGVDSKALYLNEGETFRYVYVQKNTLANLQITESYEGTLIERSFTVLAYVHYNFVLKKGEGNVNIIDLVMADFVLEEEEIIIGGAVIEDAVFFATDLGTIKCPEAAVGDKGMVNGKEYEAVDRALLIQRRNEGADLTCVCTSLVTDMSELFSDRTTFNQPIGNWDVSNVTDMNFMFFYTEEFNQDIGNWDVSKVTNMSWMFFYSGFNQDIGNWNVSNVTDMGSMFDGSSFNQPIGTWDVSKVTDMTYMFSSSQFNQPIGNWNVSNVTNMTAMFTNTPFNQAIGNWDVSNVTNMFQMFQNSLFNQPIGDWDVSNVTQMAFMFLDSQFNQDISSWCVTKISSEPLNFSLRSPLTSGNKPEWGTCPD